MTFVSTLGQSIDQIERLKITQLQLAGFQNQIASGKKTQVFKGLGTDVIPSERAREGLTKINNYVNNINIADRRLKLMVQSLTQFKKQAEDVLNALEIQTQKGEIELDSISDLASNTSNFLRDLANSKDGDRYLFGGSDTTNPPLNSSGTLDTYLLTQLQNWANPAIPANAIDTDQLIASYQDNSALTDTIIGYSSALSSGTAKNVYVRVDDYTEINYTVFANTDGMRDVIAGVNMLANLNKVIDEVTLDPDDPPPPGTITAPGATQQEQNDNFYKFFNDIAAMMNKALDSIDQQLYQLSQSQAQIAKIKDGHKLEQSILQETVDDVENADMNEVAVKLNSLQIQLEASYRVTASISSLSLVNFL